jgi:hypothetical protein
MNSKRKAASKPAISDSAMGRMDAILAKEEELIPSSGFLSAVMERVDEAAAAPAPIPFPWKRAVPGMALAAGVFSWGAYELVRYAITAKGASTFGPGVGGVASTFAHGAVAGRPTEQVVWVVVALAISGGSWLLSRRIAGGSGGI